jgi:HEPN domain-containing protein
LPLNLNDDEVVAIMEAAAPIASRQRGHFLKSLATELERHEVVGDRLMHRLCADLQKRYVVGAQRDAEVIVGSVLPTSMRRSC